MSGSAGPAFRFIKSTQQVWWVGKDGASQDTAAPHELLEGERAKWAGIWREVPAGPRPRVRCPQARRLARLRGEEIEAAASSFKVRTCAMGGLHPRQLLAASSAARGALGHLLQLIEVWGAWPKAASELAIRLIPKASGGHRPIALYGSVYRVWGRARRRIVQEWAQERLRGSEWNNMSGRTATDAVWRQLVRTHDARWRRSGAAAGGKDTTEVLIDLAAMFDRIDVDELAASASARAFPGAVLRANLATYGWPRRLLGDGGATVTVLVPSRGVAPGSPYAVFEAALSLAPAVERHCREFPAVRLSVHVDDMSFSGETPRTGQAQKEEVAARTPLVQAVKSMVADLDGVGMLVACNKTVVLSTSVKAGQGVTAALQCIGAQHRLFDKRLGAQYGLTQRQCKQVGRSRMKVFGGKVRRLRRLACVRGMGTRTGKLYQSLSMGPLFGTDIVRLGVQEMRRLRREAALRLGLGGRRSRPGLVWALGRHGDDPLCRQAWQGFSRYHKEWFMQEAPVRPDDLLRPEVLARAHRRAVE